MEENSNLGRSDDIQEVVLPFTIEEEKISGDEQSNSPTTRHGMSNEWYKIFNINYIFSLIIHWFFYLGRHKGSGFFYSLGTEE